VDIVRVATRLPIWTVAFLPGAITMIAAYPISFTRWGSVRHAGLSEVQSNTLTTANEIALLGMLWIIVAGIPLAFLIAGVSKPRSPRSIGRVGASGALVVGASWFSFQWGVLDWVPLLVFVPAVGVFVPAFCGRVLRLTVDVLLGHRATST
jgi:hypothetical protein